MRIMHGGCGIGASTGGTGLVGVRIAMAAGLAAATPGAALGQAAPPATWVEDAAGIWVAGAGGAFTKPRFNPAAGVIGNMGNNGVRYRVGVAPGVAADAAARQAEVPFGFAGWNQLGGGNVRINFQPAAAGQAAQIPISWAVIAAPGDTTLGAGPVETIRLNRTRTLRTDGWSLDFAGTRPNALDENDIRTTAIHEAGHSLGLNHPPAVDQVMTPNNTARQNANGLWRTQEFGPAGSPRGAIPVALNDLNGNAVPATTRGYSNPRAILQNGDATGAMTLYSAPMARVGGAAMPAGGGGGRPDFMYSYTVNNDSAFSAAGMAAYRERETRIPVDPAVTVTDMTASPGWNIVRTATDVRVTYAGTGGVIPGEMMGFSFHADQPPTLTTPVARWMVEGLSPSGATDPGDEDEMRPGAAPVFNPLDFGVIDEGRYTYHFDTGADAWMTTLFNPVVTPVPMPGTLALLGMGGLIAARRRRA